MEKEMHQKFVELWNQDVPIKEISAQFGISNQVATMYACRHRDECPIRKKRFDKDKVAKLWKENLTAGEIAKKLGVQKESLFAHIDRNRELYGYRRKDFSDKHKKIIEMWKNKKTAKEIAEAVGMSKSGVVLFVQRHRDECGYHTYKRGTGYDEKELIKLWNQKMPIAQIAEKLGVSQATVAGFAKSHRDKCPQRWVKSS